MSSGRVFAAPVALLVVALALPSRASRSMTGIADAIETNLDAWDIEGAQRGLDDLLSRDGRSATAAYYRGRVLFEQGKYAEAVVAYDEARSRGAAQIEGFEVEARLARAVAEEVKGDEVHESAHFVLLTRPGKDSLLAPYALEALEKAYAALTQDLGVSPSPKIRWPAWPSG